MIPDLVILLSLFFANDPADYDACPSAYLIHPCNCSSEASTIVQCANIYQPEKLVEIFRRSGDRSFNAFALHQSSLSYIPAHLISSNHFTQVMIADTFMSSLFDETPDVSNNLGMFVLRNVSLQRGLKWDLFANFQELTHLHVKQTFVRRLTGSFSKNINKNISHVGFEYSETKRLSDDVFSELTELEAIEISHCGLTTLKRSMFPRPAKIRYFIFAGNLIETLPDDMFADMPDLETIDLSENRITIFSENVFGGVYNSIKSLRLGGNPLTCDCSMKWFITREWKFMNADCAAPEDKAGRSMESLTTDDFRYCD